MAKKKAKAGRSRPRRPGHDYPATGDHDETLAVFDQAIELNPAEDEFAAARAELCQLITAAGPVPGSSGAT
jgi:hypothetical protein